MQASTIPSVTAVILAGGFGTRVKHLVPGIPKPMAPVLSRPFVDWVIDYLHREGVAQFVLSTGYLAEVISHHFADGGRNGIRVECVREDEPLGTAGGFLNASLGSSAAPGTSAWLIVNGDSLTVTSLKPLLDLVHSDEADGGLLGVECPEASRFGTLEVDPDGWLQRFREKQPGAGLINAGVYLLKSRILRGVPSHRPLSFETELFPELLASGARLRVIRSEAEFLDIGTPESLAQAEAFVAGNASWF